jgi:hypothetical protein
MPARLLSVADGQHDLDVGRQQPRTLQPLGRLAHGPTDGSCRSLVLPLREARKGQARLWFPSAATRFPVRLLRCYELPLEATDLRLLVEGLARPELVHVLFETLASSLRLVERVLPGTLDLHDLGAMHQAPAGERHHVRLPRAPVRQGGRPLLGATQRVHLLTKRDHRAVDQARDDGRQLPRGDRDHGLVQQPETLLDPPLFDQRAALLLHRKGEQVSIAEALAHPGSVDCGRVRSLPGPCGHLLQHDREQQIPALDALTLLPFQEALRTSEPSGGGAHLTAEGEIGPQPKRTAHRAQRLSDLEVRVMGPLQRALVLIAQAEHVGGRCEELEVPGCQRRPLIRA